MLLRWLRPHGGKSLLLNNELKKGPALFLFIPFNPLAESHPLIDEVSDNVKKKKVPHKEQENLINLASSHPMFRE